MRVLGQTLAFKSLNKITAELKRSVAVYEGRAKSCLRCETPGACCLDEHFVNVHISRLEAAAIVQDLSERSAMLLERVRQRTADCIDTYGLDKTGDPFSRTFACPLFERGIGCLVHEVGKPVPCIVHACYENKSDLPPDELEAEAERNIDDLNARTYGRRSPLLPLPVALMRYGLGAPAKDVAEDEA